MDALPEMLDNLKVFSQCVLLHCMPVSVLIDREISWDTVEVPRAALWSNRMKMEARKMSLKIERELSSRLQYSKQISTGPHKMISLGFQI